MTVRVIALVTINEDQPLALAKYLEITTPVLDRVGAKITSRYQLDDQIVGTRPAETVIVVEYPNREAVDEVFGSAEYKRAIPFRDIAFSDYRVSMVS